MKLKINKFLLLSTLFVGSAFSDDTAEVKKEVKTEVKTEEVSVSKVEKFKVAAKDLFDKGIITFKSNKERIMWMSLLAIVTYYAVKNNEAVNSQLEENEADAEDSEDLV